MVRQDSKALQHKDATARSDSERLNVGKEECTISVKRFWKAASPICGVTPELAPGGAQIENPVSQSPLEFTDETESADTRIAMAAISRIADRMLITANCSLRVVQQECFEGKLK